MKPFDDLQAVLGRSYRYSYFERIVSVDDVERKYFVAVGGWWPSAGPYHRFQGRARAQGRSRASRARAMNIIRRRQVGGSITVHLTITVRVGTMPLGHGNGAMN